MARFSSLRVRFALWTAGLLLAALLAFSAYVYLSTGQGLRAALDDSLQLSAAQAIAGIGGENVNVEDGQLSLADNIVEGEAAARLRARGLTLRVLTVAGQVQQAVGVYSTLPVDAASLSAARAGAPGYATIADAASGESVRVYSLPLLENGTPVGIVQTAQSLEGVQSALERLLTTLLIGVPLLVVVAGAGGYLLAARALRPIDTITRTAQRISAEDLHARLNLPPSADEVGRLAATFDGMLGRLDGAFQRERQFTADASHELRTPLAAMEAILTVTHARPRSGPEYDQALDDLTAQTRRLRGLIENLLHMARGETSQLTVHEPVDLGMLVSDVVETLRPLADERAITLTATIAANLQIVGDRDGLIRLFLNLIDNALKYTERGAVAVQAQAGPGQVVVTIRDTGIGVAPEHILHLFERFYRVDTARNSGGAGLGLAIAREIAAAHRGSIEVTSTAGVGSTFTVRLPYGRGAVIPGG